MLISPGQGNNGKMTDIFYIELTLHSTLYGIFHCMHGSGYLGLDNGLAPNRWQAIIWTNADLIQWYIYAAVGGDELTDCCLLMPYTWHNRSHNGLVPDSTKPLPNQCWLTIFEVLWHSHECNLYKMIQISCVKNTDWKSQPYLEGPMS